MFRKKEASLLVLTRILFTLKIGVSLFFTNLPIYLQSPCGSPRGGKDIAPQQVQGILFFVVFTPPPSHQGSVWLSSHLSTVS
jgi:hypothetical protein